MENLKVASDTESLRVGGKEKINSKKTFYAIFVGLMAASTILIDYGVSSLLIKGCSFVWISFISWTLNTPLSNKDRFKSIPGATVGYLFANAMNLIAKYFEIFSKLSFLNLPIGSVFSTFLFNFIIMKYITTKKLGGFIPHIFFGMSLAFSGLGIGLFPDNPLSLLIILIYDIVGLLCCLGCDFLSKKFLN